MPCRALLLLATSSPRSRVVRAGAHVVRTRARREGGRQGNRRLFHGTMIRLHSRVVAISRHFRLGCFVLLETEPESRHHRRCRSGESREQTGNCTRNWGVMICSESWHGHRWTARRHLTGAGAAQPSPGRQKRSTLARLHDHCVQPPACRNDGLRRTPMAIPGRVAFIGRGRRTCPPLACVSIAWWSPVPRARGNSYDAVRSNLPAGSPLAPGSAGKIARFAGEKDACFCPVPGVSSGSAVHVVNFVRRRRS